MGINLRKGQRIDLSKGNDGISKLIIGLGWDAITQKKKGLFGKAPASFDCDASAIMLNENEKMESSKNFVFYNNLRSICGSVVHSGDNLTGDGDGDDEQICVDLSRVPSNISKIIFFVTIYDCVSKVQDFGMVKNAFIRIVDPINNNELIMYNLTDNYAGKTALIAGEIYRHSGGWKFVAIGEGTNDTSVTTLVNRYQ